MCPLPLAIDKKFSFREARTPFGLKIHNIQSINCVRPSFNSFLLGTDEVLLV